MAAPAPADSAFERRARGATPAEVLDGTWAALRPPPRLSLSEWADTKGNFVLSAESAASPGRWKCLPYQRGILDAISDPAVERVSVMKSARVGWTKLLNITIAYHMVADPCPIMLVQETVEDAEGYSKEEIAPMLRDVPVLAGLVSDSARTSKSTILEKHFPGGLLSMCGANSARGFRRVSRRVVALDEVESYPPSAGNEGDPVMLAERRAEYYHNRKILAGSTPLIAGASRIEQMFEAGDRRRYHVPCPTCGHMDFLRFTVKDDDPDQRGHRMRWYDDDPSTACFQCSANGCAIEERDKLDMLERGKWIAEGEFKRHASFHIWAAYSMSPNARWSDIVEAFLTAVASGKPQQLQTVVNTLFGETWKERGEAPEWRALYDRRETYATGTIPSSRIIALTCGTDVQKDRIVWEIVGWARNKENWSIDAGELYGDTALEKTWEKFESDVINREFPTPDGGVLTIRSTAIDCNYNTQTVYNFARQHDTPRVIAVRGTPGWGPMIGAAVYVDVTVNGRRIQRGARMFPVGANVIKQELYAWLKLRRGDGGDYPPGYCHFPEYGEDFFQQLTAESLVKVVNRQTNQVTLRFENAPNQDNHYLDQRVYGRAAVALLGLDRLPPRQPAPNTPVAPAARQTDGPGAARPAGSWLQGRRSAARPGGYWRRR